MHATARYEVLGPLRVTAGGGADVTPTGALQRRLLSVLLLHRGETVSVDRLVHAVWGAERPPESTAALHSHISRLRKRIPASRIEFAANGYLFELGEGMLDAERFVSLVSHASAHAASDAAKALTLLDEALGCWRGRPYADLEDIDEGRIEIERLSEIYMRAREERFAALIALGRASEAVADLEGLVAREPLRERPRVLLMDALSATGRRAEALRVYDAYRLTLAEDLGVSPSPEIRAHHDGLLALDDATIERPTPPARTSQVDVLATLPRRPISTLFGRDPLLAVLARRIADVRLLTLVGPGGVGKTRLAVELAHRVAHQFDAGVLFCDLTTVAHQAGDREVANAVCSVLGVEPRSATHPADRVAEVLRHDHALLVLDNCEHVVDGAAEVVERLLGATEGLRVLTTSRERLAADGETVFAVAPLDTSSRVGRSMASELFLDRASSIGAELTSQDEPVVDELCRRLDGLPLALELAASRLRSLTLHEICAGVDQSLAVLHGARRTDARHRSLEAALDWSYRLLDPIERATLAVAATFAAPFEARDAAALMEYGDDGALERLASLVERSLVLRSGDRFRLLETVREFVREVTDSADRDELRLRHARHFTQRVVEASQRLRVAEDDEPIALARRLVPDLRQAFATVVDGNDAELALELVTECRDLALDAALPELLTWGERAAELGIADGTPLAVDAFAIAALGRWKMGDLDAMCRLLDRASAESERLGLPDRYEVLSALGTEDIAHGHLAQAIDRLERSINTVEARNDVHRLAEGGATLAICRAYSHDERAGADATWLVSDVAPRGGVVPRSWCWYAAGECLLDDDPALAAERLEQAVELARRGGATFVEGVAGASLASLMVRDGRLGEAIGHYRWLVPLWLRAGVRAPFWTMLRSVVVLLETAGEDQSAARLLGAVTSSGNDVIADDDARLRKAEATLRDRLGDERYEHCVATGRSLDAAAAAAEMLAAFDRIA